MTLKKVFGVWLLTIGSLATAASTSLMLPFVGHTKTDQGLACTYKLLTPSGGSMSVVYMKNGQKCADLVGVVVDGL